MLGIIDLKKLCVDLEPCRLEDVEEDVEKGNNLLFKEGVEEEGAQLVKAL